MQLEVKGGLENLEITGGSQIFLAFGYICHHTRSQPTAYTGGSDQPRLGPKQNGG